MEQSSLPKHPKMEEEQVPDSIDVNFFSEPNKLYTDIVREEIDILGIEDEENMENLNWDSMEWEEFSINEVEEEDKLKIKVENYDQSSMFFQEESHFSCTKGEEDTSHTVGDEIIDHENRQKNGKCLNLRLNYQRVLDAWSDRSSLWADDDLQLALSTTNNGYMGEVPMMEEDRTRREASVLRYKEKRQSRLFSRKIRYQVRKLNADKRPRLKGRFIKRISEKIFN